MHGDSTPSGGFAAANGPERCNLGSQDLANLHQRIERMLDRLGVETQPRVALRLIEMASDPDVQIKDYAEVIKTDWSLTGRILRLANSAFYAQRTEVTRLDRALVLLGIERTKAVTLGFYISRSLIGQGSKDVTRKVWGQSVFRACLASALAKAQCPGLASEAYVVGLMLDCGVPLMARALGDNYLELWNQKLSPAKLYEAEFKAMPFTHVDVADALMRRWRMPSLLAKPVMWHHTPPRAGATEDPLTLLHRLAYYAGTVQLGDGVPTLKSSLPTVAGRFFEIGAAGLEKVVTSAAKEYAATIGMFKSETEDEVEAFEDVTEAVQQQLIEMMDEQMGRSVKMEERGGPESLVIDGLQFDVEPGKGGEVIAYISSLSGERLMSCVVKPNADSTASIKRVLGLEDVEDREIENLMRAMRAIAA